ncbi:MULTISPECIES: RyR domain-containing protein [Thiorhodovibrio]|uniref:RyR domain-containing protein n=1 Tax=Thiorhodovibrio TaxID=61593 RepID=UPI0019125531|nr:RyR domain-containing protein [Thiorhodovibrio litoralis]
MIPNLLEVREGRLDLAVVGERETCLALLHRIGRMIARPFDAPLPLILSLSGDQSGAAEDARFAVFESLFRQQEHAAPGRRLLLFLALPSAEVTLQRIEEVTKRLAGTSGLMVLPAPPSAERQDAIATQLLAAGWLPHFVALSGKWREQAAGPGGLDSERLGRIIHELFLENAWTRGERRGAAPALQPWHRLDETYRIANRSQAEHIAVKLACGGLIATQEPVIADGSQAPLWSMPEFIEPLSCMEHDRWSSDRLLDGWVYAPKRDNAARHHPDLIPYDDLSEDIREKDRVAVATIPFILQLGGFGWRPLAQVRLVGSWPDPSDHASVKRRWRRDLARAARERAPALLEFLLDPREPRQCHVGIMLAKFGFPLSLWLAERHPVASLAADAPSRAALLHCLALCRQVVWDDDLPLAPATPSALEAMVVERGGLRIERHLAGPA